MAKDQNVVSRAKHDISTDEHRHITDDRIVRYRRLWFYSVVLAIVLSVAPLIIVSATSYYHYQEVFHAETIQPIYSITSAAKRAIEFFLAERESALRFVISEKSLEEISDEAALSKTFENLRQSFGDFVDLGLIDSTGLQQSYVGPYELKGKNYQTQSWFGQLKHRKSYISDVFLGHRHTPHFIIVVRKDVDDGGYYMLRAAISTEMINRKIDTLGIDPSNDAFLVNRDGILQTSSRYFGPVMTKAPVRVPAYVQSHGEIIEELYVKGGPSVLGYAFIDGSPFVFMVIKSKKYLIRNLVKLRHRWLGFLAGSILTILVMIISLVSYFVLRIKKSELRRIGLLHQAEYTNKMATLGRLSAGVAHEINNPLSIINQKAGLARDLITLEDDFPKKKTFEDLLDSILKSVERCAAVTHRLLGFARHMDPVFEAIRLEELIREVLTFLEKEALHRNVHITLEADKELPSIQSDRGQLQQVFLNIINNSFESLHHGGRVDIEIKQIDDNNLSITVSDNGAGIPKKHLKHIFEPFFTTKRGMGTGLGLSVTYGIMKELGGKIDVRSTVGEGTTFIVILPLKSQRMKATK